MKLPHSEEAERYLITSAVMDGSQYCALIQGLPADVFLVPACRTIWQAVQSIHTRAEPITIPGLVLEITALKAWDKGDQIVRTLDGIPLAEHLFGQESAHPEHLADILRRLWHRRELAKAAHALYLAASDPASEAAHIAELLRACVMVGKKVP